MPPDDRGGLDDHERGTHAEAQRMEEREREVFALIREEFLTA